MLPQKRPGKQFYSTSTMRLSLNAGGALEEKQFWHYNPLQHGGTAWDA